MWRDSYKNDDRDSKQRHERIAQRLSALNERDLSAVYALMDRAVQEQVTPGVWMWVGALPTTDGFRAEREWGAGRISYEPGATAVSSQTRYDLASLTKPLVTALWFNTLISAKTLDPQQPIGEVLSCEDPALAQTPLWRLLNHTSGLPAHFEYFRGLGGARLAGAPPERCRRHLATSLR